MLHKNKRLHAQAGMTLIEATLVLGVFSLVIGAIFAAWGAVNAQSRLRTGADTITTIVQQVRNTYANRTTLDAVSGSVFTNALINSEILPKAWLNANNQIQSPWGGIVLITPDTNAVADDSMNISFAALGQSECLNFVNKMLGVSRSQGLYKINSQAISPTTNFTSISGSVCSSGTAAVNFYFTLKAN